MVPVNKVQVYILTYNRPQFILGAVESALQQERDNYEVIVSDNSTNDDTQKIFLRFRNPILKYIKRTPCVSMIDHFNIVLKEIKGDYFMIFHDDDVMMDGLISKLLYEFTPSTAAVASNAYLIKNNLKTELLYVPGLNSNKTIVAKRELLSDYLYNKRIVPFPGYLYKHAVSKIEFNMRFGKYADVYFLSQVLELGSITVIRDPLFYYRTHDEQNSFFSDYEAKSHLTSFILRECGLSRKEKTVVFFRLRNIYDELRTRLLKGERITCHKVFRFVLLCIKNFNFILIFKMMYRIIQYRVHHR